MKKRMMRWMTVLIGGALLMSLSACGAEKAGDVPAGATEPEQYAFNAVVSEAGDKHLLVRPVEGESILRSADLISVSKTIEAEKTLPVIQEGDEVRIVYDGTVAESYPAQVHRVYDIQLIRKSETPGQILNVQYIRTNGYVEWLAYPRFIQITSKADLETYYETYAGIYEFDKRYQSDEEDWLETVSRYDDAWFAEHVLYMLVVEEGSGSIRHSVKGLEEIDGKTYLNLERIVPACCDCDMAEWHILIESDRVIPFAGVKMAGSDMPVDSPVYTAEQAADMLADYMITCAADKLTDEERRTVTNLDNPVLVKLSFGDIKDVELYYFYGDYLPGWDESPVWRVTFHTEADGVLGPIRYYLSPAGHVFASDFRE